MHRFSVPNFCGGYFICSLPLHLLVPRSLRADSNRQYIKTNIAHIPKCVIKCYLQWPSSSLFFFFSPAPKISVSLWILFILFAVYRRRAFPSPTAIIWLANDLGAIYTRNSRNSNILITNRAANARDVMCAYASGVALIKLRQHHVCTFRERSLYCI